MILFSAIIHGAIPAGLAIRNYHQIEDPEIRQIQKTNIIFKLCTHGVCASLGGIVWNGAELIYGISCPQASAISTLVFALQILVVNQESFPDFPDFYYRLVTRHNVMYDSDSDDSGSDDNV